ncbi:MAG: hypothetical protein D3904_17055 [Candidatus Electrothrix sp. EH2]|nr:hypothetical protein [Candidatus Electrothrix sp. EH2]
MGPKGDTGTCELPSVQCDFGQMLTGWIDGQPICEDIPVNLIGGCETAFAYGNTTLNSFLNTNRWGWEITVNKDQSLTKPIYAGAGQNDISKGTQVGELAVAYTGTTVTVTYTMTADDIIMKETHLYGGEESVTTAAPGQYGLQDTGLINATTDTYVVTVSGEAPSLKIVAHAVTCGKD